MRVLFAGVNVRRRLILKAYLKQHKHEFKMVSNGLGCISSLRENNFSILVMEQQLLWGGSEGVISLMHEEPMLSSIPVILLPEIQKLNFIQVRSQSDQKRARPFHLGDMIGLVQFLESKSMVRLSSPSRWPFPSYPCEGARIPGDRTTIQVC